MAGPPVRARTESCVVSSRASIRRQTSPIDGGGHQGSGLAARNRSIGQRSSTSPPPPTTGTRPGRLHRSRSALRLVACARGEAARPARCASTPAPGPRGRAPGLPTRSTATTRDRPAQLRQRPRETTVSPQLRASVALTGESIEQGVIATGAAALVRQHISGASQKPWQRIIGHVLQPPHAITNTSLTASSAAAGSTRRRAYARTAPACALNKPSSRERR